MIKSKGMVPMNSVFFKFRMTLPNECMGIYWDISYSVGLIYDFECAAEHQLKKKKYKQHFL